MRVWKKTGNSYFGFSVYSNALRKSVASERVRDKGGKMFILELNQEGIGTEIGLFRTIEEGRVFISQVNGYRFEEEEGFVYESLDIRKLPEYLELHYKGNIVPFSKFMFTEEGDIDIFWKEIPDLSSPGKGMVEGCTRVDAYAIPNEEVKDYIEKRELQYKKIKGLLEEMGYEADRAYFGSEDGEAVLYRKKGTEDWHFLTHIDPGFIEDDAEELLKEAEL